MHMAWFIAVLKHRLGTLTNSPVCLNQCSFCLEICMVYHLLMHSLVLFHKCSKHPLRYESLLAESVNFVQKNGLGGSVYSRFLSIILFAKLIPVNQSGTKSCSKFGEHFFFCHLVLLHQWVIHTDQIISRQWTEQRRYELWTCYWSKTCLQGLPTEGIHLHSVLWQNQ